jgi:hypothetical protein
MGRAGHADLSTIRAQLPMSPARLILLSALTVSACMPQAGAPVTAPAPANGLSETPALPAAQLPAIEFDVIADSAMVEGTEATASEDEVAAVMSPEPAAPPADASWDIEVREYLEHDRVEFYVKRFTGEARARVVSWMQRGIRYEPMIRRLKKCKSKD